MSKLTELPVKAQVGIIVGLAVALTVGLYFLVYKSMDDQNRANRASLQTKKAENDQLRPYINKLADMNRQIESLKQQLEIQKRIVPDEKEAGQFMRLMQETASAAGIEVRRYTAKPGSSKEFYTEVPFEMELDGRYYSLLTFFEQVSKLERIVNISNVQLASVKKPSDAKTKKTYRYAPTESVVSTCMATTFFSHDAQPVKPAPGPGGKQPAAATVKD